MSNERNLLGRNNVGSNHYCSRANVSTMVSLRTDLLEAKIKRLALNEEAPWPTYQAEAATAWQREVERIKAWRESLQEALREGERNE